MKGLIRFILNAIPRPVLQRMAGWAVPLLGLLYVGRGRECPVCGTKRRKFLPYGYVISRDNALCPNCLSLERHRLLWLWLQRESDLFEQRPRLLHVAPEVCLMRHLRRTYAGGGNEADYVTADLESPLADLHFDIQQIPLEDESFDVVFCNHIMEHVEDDLRAMRELYRVMRRGGWGVILSPVELDRATTFEDDSITDEAERTRIFGQYDHRRVYGRDYADRLREAGFEVEDLDYAATLAPDERTRFALPSDHLYIVRKQ
ncbi:MAG: methyltransferase domain-containing protein [Rikenellaceae bacterium]|nr:methyltransferase domain-containing protein [Rikenellaceae bacterium]